MPASATTPTTCPLPALATSSHPGFNRLEALVGEWQGSARWTGAIETESHPVQATYTLTGNGSSIIIHAKPDTHSADPGAGGRIACGVIGK